MSLKDKRAEIKLKFAELKALAQKIFSDESKELFNKYPELVSFSWTQYTPYFNDGDTCVFHSQKDYPEVSCIHPDGNMYSEDSNYGEYDGPDDDFYNKQVKDMLEDVRTFLKTFQDSELLELFGDHAKIVINRDGSKVSEFEHD